MAQETENETSGKDRVKKLVLPGALAAISAGVGLLLTAKPERLRQAIDKLSGQAREVAGDLKQRDLMGDLKERAESVTSQMGGGEPDRSDGNDFEARRREREQRRNERRQRART
jgi:hypothetical protein